MNAIETKQLTKFYGSARGIENLDLSVEQGDFFGFIGPNGAGKSTTIRTLLGLIHPTGGSASVLGLDIRKQKTEILSRVGYLPSEITFYPGMKVSQVLRLSARLHKKDCEKEAQALCQRLQLDVSRRVEDLSLGNRKKVGIVCALQHRPELLILDEATSGLDPLMPCALGDSAQLHPGGHHPGRENRRQRCSQPVGGFRCKAGAAAGHSGFGGAYRHPGPVPNW